MESKPVRPYSLVDVDSIDEIPIPVVHCANNIQITRHNRAAQAFHPGFRDTKDLRQLARLTNCFGDELDWEEFVDDLTRNLRTVSVVAQIKRGSRKYQSVLCHVSMLERGEIQFLFVPQVSELDRIVSHFLEAYLRKRRKDDLFAAITSEAHRITCADRTFLKVHDRRTDLLAHKALVPSEPQGRSPDPCRPERAGLPGLAFLHRRHYYSRRIRDEKAELSHTCYPDTVSRLAVPIIRPSSGQVYGVLVVDGTKEDQFGNDAFWACATIARYAAFAFAEAQSTEDLRSLYDQTLADMREGNDGRLVASVLHDGKRMIGNTVDALEEIENELAGKAFGKRASREIARKLVQIRHVGGLMEVMLHKLKARATRDQPPVGPVDLRAVAQRLVSVLSLSEGEFAEVSLEAADRTYPIRAREYHLVALLYNLLSNAISAIKQSARMGKVIVRLESTPKTPGWCRIIVSDDGPGMSADQLELARAGVPFSRTAGGFGLGLGTVRSIVKELGGRSFVDSKLGRATRFIIDLPED